MSHRSPHLLLQRASCSRFLISDSKPICRRAITGSFLGSDDRSDNQYTNNDSSAQGGVCSSGSIWKQTLAVSESIAADAAAGKQMLRRSVSPHHTRVLGTSLEELLSHSSIALTRDTYTHIRQSRKAVTAKKLSSCLSEGKKKTDPKSDRK